jgi:predicted DNA-binding transcriptional regulator AlpA
VPDRLFSIADVMAQPGIKSRTTWAKVSKHKDFPEPLRIPGLSRPRWRQADLDRWAQQRAEKECA